MLPETLILKSWKVITSKPLAFFLKIRAKGLLKEFQKLMTPTIPVTLTVSDPVTALAIAALNFACTQAGQTIILDVTKGLDVVIADIVKFVHSKLPTTVPSSTPTASLASKTS